MSELIEYKLGIDVLSPEPEGAGGVGLNTNFRTVADLLENHAADIADRITTAALVIALEDYASTGSVQTAQTAADEAQATIDAHVANTGNPHSVTKTQVGLSAVTNDAQLKIASNLSDLANAATARSNLGLGSAALSATSDFASASSFTTHTSATAAHGVTGAIVGTTDTQTLTGKTISGGSNTLTNIAQSSVTSLTTDLSARALTTTSISVSGGLLSGGGTLAADRTISLSGADIFTDLKTRDGAGSGLDADLLDGMNPSLSSSANTIVMRGPMGNIAAGTITCFAVVGDVTGNVTGNISGGTVAGTASGLTISGASNTLTNIAQSSVTSLTADLALKAPLASPTFTGTPAAPTATSGTNTTQIATTAFVRTELAGLTILKASASITFDFTTNQIQYNNVSVPGAAINDVVVVGVSKTMSDGTTPNFEFCTFRGYVVATDTVTILGQDLLAFAPNGTATFKIVVFKL